METCRGEKQMAEWEKQRNRTTALKQTRQRRLRCSKTSSETSSPTPTTAAACQASLPPSFPPLLPLLFPIHLFHRVSWAEVRAGLLSRSSEKLEIRARMDAASQTNPYLVKFASLFLSVDSSLSVCLHNYTSQESLITNLCLESSTTLKSTCKTEWICAHLAGMGPYVLRLSLVVNHWQTAESINKHRAQRRIKIQNSSSDRARANTGWVLLRHQHTETKTEAGRQRRRGTGQI